MNAWNDLTARQKEVCRLFLETDNDRKQISSMMCISMTTVKTHFLRIYERFGFTNYGGGSDGRHVVKLAKALCKLQQEGVL